MFSMKRFTSYKLRVTNQQRHLFIPRYTVKEETYWILIITNTTYRLTPYRYSDYKNREATDSSVSVP